jgi:hypothetical protein
VIILRARDRKLAVDRDITAPYPKFLIKETDEYPRCCFCKERTEIFRSVTLYLSRRENAWVSFVCDLEMRIQPRLRAVKVFYGRVVFHEKAPLLLKEGWRRFDDGVDMDQRLIC